MILSMHKHVTAFFERWAAGEACSIRLNPALGCVAWALVLVVVGGCSREADDKDPIVSVQVATAVKTTLRRDVSSEAVLFPLQQSAIASKISAPVRAFYVTRGSKVHKGQLLATLENRDLEAATEENEGAYQQAQAAYETTTAASLPEELQKAKLDAQAARQGLDAQEKLYHSREELFQQGALPRKELDQSRVDLTNARNQSEIAQRHLDALTAIGKQQQLKSAAGQLQAAKGHYQGSEAQLSYSQIRSPIDGYVTDRPLYPGEMAAAGVPLITVMDLSQVIAKAHITQPDAALLKLNDPATILVPGEEKPVEGRITVISPALDPNSTTVEIWVQASNPGRRLKPGTSVQVTMLAQTVKDAVAIPPISVLPGPDGTASVMVVGPDNRAHQTAVKTGIQQADQVQILSGIEAGASVITTGAFGLPDKTKVKIETPATPPAEKPGAAHNNQ